MSERRQTRCAIYTRKSSEEGLEQDFNSLDAQRGACEAYIASQAHEGWRCLPERFDDGGHSGGTLERPALQRLLDAVRERRIDVMVIYKIDRLTRSLADFARLADLFDAQGVSFVSVTQQFNTTTSMGRLMLNVLLSFAQFEREITGERIRDKIAASKKKGLWMGGNVPLGYDAVDRKLVVNETDAETVRTIFRLYLEIGGGNALLDELDRRGIRTRVSVAENGRKRGGNRFARGPLYHLLANPVYIGRIPHRDQSYPGQHEPIIDRETWDAVQARLTDNTQGPRKRGRRPRDKSPLAGLLVSAEGNRYMAAHANKGGRRYRYYVEQVPPKPDGISAKPRRLPAPEIERAVRDALVGLFGQPDRVVAALGDLSARDTATVLNTAHQVHEALRNRYEYSLRELIRPALDRIHLAESCLTLCFDGSALHRMMGLEGNESVERDEPVSFDTPVSVRSRGPEMKLVLAGGASNETGLPDPAMVRAIVRAHAWFERLKTGEAQSVGEIAGEEGVTTSFVTRTMRLAFLAPDIVEQILRGCHVPQFRVGQIMLAEDIALRWSEQLSRAT